MTIGLRRTICSLGLALLISPAAMAGIVSIQNGAGGYAQAVSANPFGAIAPGYSVYDNFDGHTIPAGGGTGGANTGLSFKTPGYASSATLTLSTDGAKFPANSTTGPWIIDVNTGSGGADRSFGRGPDPNSANPNAVTKIDSIDEMGIRNSQIAPEDNLMVDQIGKTLFAGGSGSTRTITFNFAANTIGSLVYELPTFFGIIYTDGFGDLSITAYNGMSVIGSLFVSSPFDNLISGQTAEDTWVGISGLGGITKVEISLVNIPAMIGGTLGGGIELDHLFYAGNVTNLNSTVPEPTSMAMWGVGALGLLVVRRRRKA